MRVNSFDEWTQLREVVLGSALNYTSHEREISFDLFFHDNIQPSEWVYPRVANPRGRHNSRTSINEKYVDELNEDLQGIEDALVGLGVKVLRPMDLSAQTADVQTLDWSASVVPPLNVRDNTIVLGNEILETAPMVRSRYFETRFMQKIFMSYFREGSGWSTMPRPIMTDNSFDPSYAVKSQGGPTEPISNPTDSPYDVGYEIMIDGAQCLKLGADVVVNVATANHRLGFEWLQRHYEGVFRFHKVDGLSDSHIDSKVLALKPGLLLARNPGVMDYLPDKLRKWDYVVPPAPSSNNFPTYDRNDLILASPYIDLNVLSINEETVMVNEACPELISELERRRFTVVPVRHRHRRLFGGGFHCFTLDTVRDGGYEVYLD